MNTGSQNGDSKRAYLVYRCVQKLWKRNFNNHEVLKYT